MSERGNQGRTRRESGSPRIHMKTIYKYEINELGLTRLKVPMKAIPRSVDVDMNGESCIWFEVDTDKPEEYRYIYSIGTGMPLDTSVDLKYIGTINDNGYMWHVFEAE